MNHLFSSFDPLVKSLPLNWVMGFFVIMVMYSSIFLGSSQWKSSENFIVKLLIKEFNAVFSLSSHPSNSSILLSLCIYLMIINSLGLLPYVFTNSSHLMFTLSIGLPFWLGHNLMSWSIQPQACLSHLIPLGTPKMLIFFMFCIELLSNLIRPLTLSIRLMANMTAGHLLFSLISVGLQVTKSSLLFVLIFSVFLLLMMLELGVALIQAYVFSLLSALYIKEHSSLNLETK